MKVCFIVGKFQPLHKAHVELINYGIKEFKEIIILVGSSNSPCTFNNFLSFNKRSQAIKNIFPNIKIYPIADYLFSSEKWRIRCTEIVNNHYSHYKNPKIYHLTSSKDNNDKYHNSWFNDYQVKSIPHIYHDANVINSKNIREKLYLQNSMNYELNNEIINDFVYNQLLTFQDSDNFDIYKNDYIQYNKELKISEYIDNKLNNIAKIYTSLAIIYNKKIYMNCDKKGKYHLPIENITNHMHSWDAAVELINKCIFNYDVKYIVKNKVLKKEYKICDINYNIDISPIRSIYFIYYINLDEHYGIDVDIDNFINIKQSSEDNNESDKYADIDFNSYTILQYLREEEIFE